MFSRSQAKGYFLGGTVVVSAFFLGLTFDTFRQIPGRTQADKLTPQVASGKRLWDASNCMGCHTLLGEGGYYAPELTRVYERRGVPFIKAMLKDPEAMYPGDRKMVNYNFTDAEIDDLIAFFQWVGQIDTNGFPPKPNLMALASPSGVVAGRESRPAVFNQMCIACHTLQGQGGAVGPALDGVGDRKTMAELETWLTNPSAVKPGTLMPTLPLTKEQITELAAFLTTLKN